MLSIDQIREYPLFAGLDETELAYPSACLSKRAFAKGAYIYYPGNPSLNTYLVETGLVRLFFYQCRGPGISVQPDRPERGVWPSIARG